MHTYHPNNPMTQDTHFYSNLAYDTATDRLQQVAVRGVTIRVQQPELNVTAFRLDLHQSTPIGTIVMAHLKGTLRSMPDDRIMVAYQTGAFSPTMRWLIPIVGISLSLLLLFILPASMSPIISAPGVIGILTVVFWSTMGSDLRREDRSRLRQLLERILEKQTTMMVWQA